MLFALLSISALARLANGLGLCDALIEELGEDASEYFCGWLTNTTALGPFNNQTSDITVLAFNDSSWIMPDNTVVHIKEAAESMRYYMVRGIHNSTSFPNISNTESSGWSHELLDTYLDSGNYANRTGGQRILAQGDQLGLVSFSAGGDDGAVSVKTVSLSCRWNILTFMLIVYEDIPFDNGIIHVISNSFGPPLRARDVFSKYQSILGTVLVQALYLTGMMDELEATKDFTLFAPSDAAFYNVGSIFDGMTMDELKDVLGYHIVMGNVTYSTAIAPDSLEWSISQTTLSKKTLEVASIQTNDSDNVDRCLMAGGVYATVRDYMVQNGNIVAIG
jgi:uncharacterized surface protein with fasciclin (FAS1) repeats